MLIHVLLMTHLLFTAPTATYENQTIWDLATVPEAQVNLGLWSLIVAREYDPGVDVNHYLEELDGLARTVQRGLPDQSQEAKLVITQTVLYKSGSWNQGKVFEYDMQDPLGRVTDHQLLSNYLDSRRGNCVSMPTLFLTVMERVDPTVTMVGVRAPYHLFCRFRGADGRLLTVEATQGKIVTDESHLERQNPIKPAAIASGLYLRDLTKKEYIAELMGALVIKERKAGHWQKALAYANLILELAPGATVGLVNKAAILHQLNFELAEKTRLAGGKLTLQEQKEIKARGEAGNRLLDKARALGWEPASEENRAAYLKQIRSKP